MQLSLQDNHLVLDFPYDASQVAEVKKIDGSSWDRVQKVWRLPMSSLEEARQFAAKHKFTIDIDVLTLTIQKKRPEKCVFMSDANLMLRCPYEKVIIKAVKQIPGITWNSDKKVWQAPLTSVAEVIGWAKSFDVPIAEEIHSHAVNVKESLNKLKDASRSTDAEIKVASIKGDLLPYQRAGVAYASNARRTFIADEMGLGKTLQAIATLEYVWDSYPVVVVCPPTLVLNWKAEYARWLPDKRVSIVPNRKDFPEKNSYDVVVVGYSNISHWEKELKGHQSYVFDESHYCKTPTAARTKSAVKIARTAPKEGIVLCLTGTPVTNRPAEYASQLEILGKLKDFGGLWGFYRRYCGAFQDSFGQWNISGHSHLDELNDRLRGNCYIRRTKDQVLKELPPVIHNPIIVEGTSAGMKEYHKAERDIIKYLQDRAREIALELGQSPHSAAVIAKIKAESNEHLVRLSVLRRLSARAKMPAIEEWVQAHIDEGKKVVIAGHHREVVDELARRFGGLKIQGGMSVQEVEEHKHKFQNLSAEEAPVIVLSIQAAKTGHTLTASQDVLFVELPWTPADVDQTYSRCHRLGQQGSVTATYMLASKTIDEEIYSLIERKRGVVNSAVEGGLDIGFNSHQLILDMLNR
ncbi:HepA Superfamily II DNA/RNA helicases, SNF2 family [uncultured Caudovirales phage]|uniref:HepA Superfamily II DNA/RNA helicases, SNF2 family n=1 Tax=uncultured Caudovirales phage TaxID=2100421 RepID=A0A6J5NBE2_9CAUD|nr:HepA Superfamily II DNA/RNA helicases, SNF2 family [uncultured Caudovirales phage]